MRHLDAILSMTVEELLAEDVAAARVLGLYGIDLCRSFPLALQAAARVAGANPADVARALLASSSQNGPQSNVEALAAV